jgi:hypothetical protein
MKKQYTKKQIQEAIKYWKNILENMETGNADLNSFCELVNEYKTVDEIINNERLFPYLDINKIMEILSNIFKKHNIVSNFFEYGYEKDMNMYTAPVKDVAYYKPEYEDGYLIPGTGYYDYNDDVDYIKLNAELNPYGLKFSDIGDVVNDNAADNNEAPTRCVLAVDLNIIDPNKFYNMFKKTMNRL